MKRLAALVLAGAALAARAATTNEVDVAALIAAVDAGLSETNGWTMSGLGKYADDSSLYFNAGSDSLVSKQYDMPVLAVEAYVKCSNTSLARIMCVFDDETDAELGRFTVCAKANTKEWQSFSLVRSPVSRRIRLQTTSGTSGNWGIKELRVITADPVYAPTDLCVPRSGDDWCSLAWLNGEGTVSNRVDTYLIERGAGETALLDTGFDSFDATDKKNPVPSADKLPGIDPALSGENIYAPTNTSGICQIGTGRELGFLRYDGIDDYSKVVLRLRAKRYPGDNAETTVISVDSAGATNEVETIVLGDDYADYEIGLSSVTNAGSSLLLGYYKTKSNRRVLVDSLSIVRESTDRETRLDSRWIPASPGATSFSTRGSLALPSKSECRFEVRAMNADGIVSDAAVAETRLGGIPGFRLMLR